MTMEELNALETLVSEQSKKLKARAEQQAEDGKFYFDDLVEEFTAKLIDWSTESFKKEIIRAAKEVKEAGL